jgi:hypothetical protein
MEVIIASGRDLKAVNAHQATKVAELLESAGVAGDLYHETASALAPNKTLAEQGISDGARLLATTCSRVVVRVTYNGQEISEKFPSAAAISAVHAWAVGPKGFNLAGAQRPKHVLAVCGEDVQPDTSEHVGAYADDACGVCLELLPKVRFEG